MNKQANHRVAPEVPLQGAFIGRVPDALDERDTNRYSPDRHMESHAVNIPVEHPHPVKHPIPFSSDRHFASVTWDVGEPNMCVTGTGLQYSTGTLYSEPFL